MDHHLHTSNGAVPQTIMGAPFGCNTPPATAEHAIDAQMDKFFPNIFDHVSEESSSLDSQCFLSGLDGTHHSTSLDTTMNGHDNSITSRDESSESGESLQNTPVTEQQVCSYRNSGPKKSSTSKPNPFPEIDMSFIMGESSMALCSYIPPAGLDSDTEAMSYLPKTTPNDVKRQIEQFCAKLNLHDVLLLQDLNEEDEWTRYTVEIMKALIPFILPTREQARKRKRSTRNKVARQSTKKRDTKSIEWWKRFMYLKREDIELELEQVAVVKTAVEVLRASGDQAKQKEGDEFMDVYAVQVHSMLAVERDDVLANIRYVVYALFFHIAATTDPLNWVAKGSADQKRGKFCASAVKRLFSHCGTHVLGKMTLDDFGARLRVWQVNGRKFAYLAVHLGLGSIVHLRSLLHGTQIKGMTQGGEQPVDGIKSSEAVFNHLRSLGLPELAVQSGADGMMHSLLWEVFERFAGFPKRVGDAPFPGFADGDADTSINSESYRVGSPFD